MRLLGIYSGLNVGIDPLLYGNGEHNISILRSVAITKSTMHIKVDACGIYAVHHPDHPRRSCDHVLSVIK